MIYSIEGIPIENKKGYPFKEPVVTEHGTVTPFCKDGACHTILIARNDETGFETILNEALSIMNFKEVPLCFTVDKGFGKVPLVIDNDHCFKIEEETFTEIHFVCNKKNIMLKLTENGLFSHDDMPIQVRSIFETGGGGFIINLK